MGRRRRTPARRALHAVHVPAHPRRRGEPGAAAVEFALVLPLVAMLLLGTVTVGLAYSNHLAISNAVREGARFGASAPNNASWAAAVVTDTVDSYADANSPIDGTNVCALLVKKTGGASPSYTVLQKSSAACQTGTSPAGKVPGPPTSIPDGCFIKVWAQKPADLNWIFNNTTVTLRAESVALYDRTQLC